MSGGAYGTYVLETREVQMAAAKSGEKGGRSGGGTALAVTKKEKLIRGGRGRPRKPRAADEAGVDARRLEVARLLMEHKNYREIVKALEELPAERRPANVSLSTVSRDVAALRAEWARERAQLVSEMVGEEVERLNRLEAAWWERAVDKESVQQGEATDKVLAIQRQRSALLGLTGNKAAAVQVMAGAAASAGAGGVNTEGPLPAGAQVKVRVTYVDDRRDL